jgi:hypothetical protein
MLALSEIDDVQLDRLPLPVINPRHHRQIAVVFALILKTDSALPNYLPQLSLP